MDYHKQSRRGTITVFTALIMAGIIFLDSVLIQGAMLYTARANLDYKLTLAGRSLLASYDRILYADYGLVACLEQEDAVITANRFFEGARDSLTQEMDSLVDKARGFRPGDYLILRPLQGQAGAFTVSYEDRLGDINVLQENIKSLMIYQTPANLLEYLLEAVDLIESAQISGEGERLYEEAGTLLEELSQTADKLYRAVEGWSPHDFACVNGFDDLTARQVTLGTLRVNALLLEGLSREQIWETESRTVLQAVWTGCENLLADFETYREFNRKALSYLAETRVIRRQTESKIQEIRRWISEQPLKTETDTDGSYVGLLEERVDELRSILQKTAYTNVEKRLNANISALDGGIENLKELYAYLKRWMDGDTDGELFDGRYVRSVAETAASVSPDCSISVYIGSQNADPLLLQADFRQEAERVKNELPDSVASSFSGLQTVIPELYQTLPSVTGFGGAAVLDDDSLLKSVLIDDYILTFFNNSGPDGRIARYACLRAETEYVLNGGASDEENISDTVLKLLALRSALNLLHILFDSEKMELAKAVGGALAGALSCGMAEPLFTSLVIMAWASCEADLDIKALQKGEEVPLLKTKATWKLGIPGLMESGSCDTAEETAEKPFALDYSGYLRILLFMTPQKTKLLRIQDLLEINLTSQTGTRYHMGEFCTGISVGCDFQTGSFGSGFLIRRDVHVAY